MDCLFCKIASGEVSSSKIYEDQTAVAFLDINPLSKGHTVVIPREHGGTILDYSKEVMESFFGSVQAVVARVKESINPDGFTIGINHEIGQAVPHLHVHVIPRWKEDGGGGMHSVHGKDADTMLEDVAALFKKNNPSL